MRLLIKLCFAAVGIAGASLAAAQNQAWEKLIVPGLTYRMEVDYSLPRVIHAIRYTAGSGTVFSRPELAGGAVFLPDDASRGRETVNSMVTTTRAIAGINADFFPFTGDPVGLMVRGHELISMPFGQRAVFAWGQNYAYAGPATTKLTLRGPSGEAFGIGMVNQIVPDNELGIFTSIAGKASSKAPGVYVLITPESPLPLSGVVHGTVNLLSPDMTGVNVSDNQMVIAATGNRIKDVMTLRPGAQISIEVETSGPDASKSVHAVGGGPRLITGGKVSLNVRPEAFENSFATTLHPRSAIGATANGDIWLVVVDGRQSMSRGTGLDELARVMLRLGCTEAINLDGGGSSVLALGGMSLNRPSDGGIPRAVANGVFLFGEMPTPDPNAAFVIKGLPQLTEGETTSYTVIDQAGERVPMNQVIWSAQGAAWIDQSGTVRTAGLGNATIYAWIKGTVVSVQIKVASKPQG